jgi:hypothetical protein
MLQNGTYAGGRGYPRVADQIDTAVLRNVHEWFDEHAVAWAGTPVELGNMIGRPKQQVVHAIETASETLLVFGITASLSRRPGLPTVIILRHLEEICPDLGGPARTSDVRTGHGDGDWEVSNGLLSGDPAAQPPVSKRLQKNAPNSETIDTVDRDDTIDLVSFSSFSPGDDPPHTHKRLWVLLAAIVLLAIIGMSDGTMRTITTHIVSWFTSILSQSTR